jgi:hypothetical protein
MKKFLGLLIAVAAAVAAFGAGTGAAVVSTCPTGALNESFDHSTNLSGTPFTAATGTVTVTFAGGLPASSGPASATIVFDDTLGSTLTVNASGTFTTGKHAVFTITGGTITGTGACAGVAATGPIAGVISGQNGNATWSTSDQSTDTAITGRFAKPAPGAAPVVRGPDRYGYCLNGVFLNLLLGQPSYDPLYKGATPAFYVDGVGITCDPPSGVFSLAVDLVGPDGQPAPPGYSFPSVIYPHYVRK